MNLPAGLLRVEVLTSVSSPSFHAACFTGEAAVDFLVFMSISPSMPKA
jgi:hypothetical protein